MTKRPILKVPMVPPGREGVVERPGKEAQSGNLDEECMLNPEEEKVVLATTPITDNNQSCFKERPSKLLGKNFVGKNFYRGSIVSPLGSCSPPTAAAAYNPATHFR